MNCLCKKLDLTWEQRKFGEMADYKKGPFGSALKKDIFVPKSDNSVKVYEQQNAINKNWKLERYFITKEYATELKAFETHSGDILVSCAGTIGEMYELPSESENGVINQALMRVRVNDKVVSKKIYQLLFSNMINDFSREHSNGSAMKNIPPFADLKSMNVVIPSLEEQVLIEECFQRFDNLITLHQRKLDKLVNVKKSMLEKMFPKQGSTVPEVRFSGFTEDWEQRKVGDFLTESRIRGNTGLDAKKLTVKLWGKGVVEKNDFGGSEHTQYFTRRKGQFIYSKLDFLNSAFGVIPEKLDNYESTADLPAFDLDGMNPYFMYFVAIQESFYLKHGSIADGSRKAKRIHADTFLNMPVMVPTIDEQNLIVDFVQHLDNIITLHQRKLEKLKNIKKSMLEKMFI